MEIKNRDIQAEKDSKKKEEYETVPAFILNKALWNAGLSCYSHTPQVSATEWMHPRGEYFVVREKKGGLFTSRQRIAEVELVKEELTVVRVRNPEDFPELSGILDSIKGKGQGEIEVRVRTEWEWDW